IGAEAAGPHVLQRLPGIRDGGADGPVEQATVGCRISPAVRPSEARPRTRRRAMSTLVIDPLALAVVSLLVKASALVATTAGVYAVLRRTGSAATRHLLCTVALVGLLALPLLSAVGPTWTIA